MQPRRNPWIGSLYAIAAAVLIAATYFVPRYAVEPDQAQAVWNSWLQNLNILSETPVIAPEALIPVGASEAQTVSNHSPERTENAPHQETPTIPESATARSTQDQTSSPLSETSSALRAKPIVTDQSVVADSQ